MGYRLMDYDLTEYQLLENELNSLSEQGINPVSLGRISHFKKNDKHYYYNVDLLIKKPNIPKRKAMNDLINYYEKNFFDYYGNIGKFMIFRSETKRSIPKERKKNINDFLNTRVISTLTYFVLMLIPMLYFMYVFLSNNHISEFLTNGSILLHFSVIPVALTFILRPLNKFILAFQISKNRKKITSQLLNKIFYLFVIISFIIVSLGCILDMFEKTKIEVNQQVITLSDIGLADDFDSYPTYTHAKSFIVESNSYVETNKNDDAIYSKEYIFNNNDDLDYYFASFKDEVIEKNSIMIDDNTYILNIDGQNDSILFKTGNRFVYVTTSIDIYDNSLYQNIIDFYSTKKP